MGNSVFSDVLHTVLSAILAGVAGLLLSAVRKLDGIESDIGKIKTALKIGFDIDIP